MNFGYFDEQKREYVITNPKTPTSWVNYLGTSDYCLIISNNASGYSFYKSPKLGRVTRFRFNSIPMDRPGRYVYLKDEKTNDFWSISWQPVGKPLDKFLSICRHGLGYTIFESKYNSIISSLKIFVPVDKPLEIWEVKIKNDSNEKKEFSVFTYTEFCLWNSMLDMMDFQYILYTCRMGYNKEDEIIDYSIKLWSPYEPKAFFTCANKKIESFDTDRDVFIGPYNSESNPEAIKNGKCFGSIAIGGNPCAATQVKIELQPGQEEYLVFLLGIGNAYEEGREYKKIFASIDSVEKEFEKVQEYWKERLNKFECNTQDEKMNLMLNIWNQYQCHTTFNWSRSASFIEAGGRDGLGFRDSSQDILGVVHSIPQEVRRRLIELLKAQLSEGYAMHHFQPLTMSQGKHNIPPRERIYSDDHLWLLIAVPAYIKETGDFSILDEIVEYADSGSASVYDHLKQALEFSWNNRGKHGLLLGLAADWNDCINLKDGGESTWSTQLYYKALSEFIELAEHIGKTEDAEKYKAYREEIKKAMDEYTWDGEWFVRGYLASGKKLGSKESEQSKIFLNSQSWAVFSGAFLDEKGKTAMDSVKKYLATEHGCVKNWPAYVDYIIEVGAITSFPPGLKENAAIFCHANTWVIIAEALLGRGEYAFEYYMSFLPANKNEIAEIYTAEPYVYSQFITGKEHPYYFGRARNPWLTGTATWAFTAATQYILGIRPHYNGIIIDPCIPSSWDGFEVKRIFRGKKLLIKVLNPEHVSKGVKKVIINGKEIKSNLISEALLDEENVIEVIMGL